MRNDELFSPTCPDDHAKRLVLGYALQGLLDDRRTYRTEDLLARQFAVYETWLALAHKSTTSFNCGFYEWLCRDYDAAFVFKPGDLVKRDGHYCVVSRIDPGGVNWVNSWRLRNGAPALEPWPQQMCTVELKNPDGCVATVNALDESIEPADIPSEVFALACGKAKNCPMLKGGVE